MCLLYFYVVQECYIRKSCNSKLDSVLYHSIPFHPCDVWPLAFIPIYTQSVCCFIECVIAFRILRIIQSRTRQPCICVVVHKQCCFQILLYFFLISLLCTCFLCMSCTHIHPRFQSLFSVPSVFYCSRDVSVK